MTLQALEFELDNIKNRFDHSFESLKYFCSKYGAKYSEIIYRILTTQVLYAAKGEFNDYGYHTNWEAGPLARMEFLVFFVGHELLDNGDPGLGWHRYRYEDGKMKMCDENDLGAEPFWHTCHEILPAGSKHLYEEEVLWVLDWHEKHEEERYESFGEQRCPEVPMLIELAKAITGIEK
jgi:hypothetical protein